MSKLLLTTIAALLTVLVASHSPAAPVTRDGSIKLFGTKTALDASAQREGQLGYALDTNTFYFRTGSAWMPMGGSVSPEFSISFNEGDDKGFYLLSSAGIVFSGTAQALNYGYYGAYKIGISLGVTGTIIPNMDATGLDITADATAANNDAVEFFMGMNGASGRPYTVGTDPAFKVCATITMADVDGSDNLLVGFREVEPLAAAHTTYTDFAAIGDVAGAIKITTDLANAGETVTDTTDTWADAATKVLCTLVSGAGVTTYTINGSAPTATAAYTFADGTLVVPWVYELQDANIAEDTILTAWSSSFQ